MTKAAGRRVAELLDPELFRALADPNRLALLGALATSEGRTVSELAAQAPVDLSVVSRHLKTLATAGILEAEKLGREVTYRVRVAHLVGILRSLADALESCCPQGRTLADDSKGRKR